MTRAGSQRQKKKVKPTEFLLALQIIAVMDVTSHRLIVRYFSDEPSTAFVTDEADYTA